MAEAVRVIVRYDTRRKDGTTRRERNENFGVPVPSVIVPDGADYLWAWFWEINEGVNRSGDGFCLSITWADYDMWSRVSGEIVTADDYAILRAMDAAYCAEMNSELSAERERLQAEAKAKGAK